MTLYHTIVIMPKAKAVVPMDPVKKAAMLAKRIATKAKKDAAATKQRKIDADNLAWYKGAYASPYTGQGKPRAKYIGNTKKAGARIKGASAAIKIATDRRQEFWPGVPPKKHRSASFPVSKFSRYPKYVFNKDGQRVFIYYDG